MRARAENPVVFVGPSLHPDEVRRMLPRARVEPPIARGDLGRLREQGATTFLLVDGAFAHRLAVAPSEIVAALRDGARIFGSASMGAVRAAECWPAGMRGSGAVYSLFRLGLIRNDDEVAVATDPQRDFAAVSVALVNLRYMLLAALRRNLLSHAHARAVLSVAKQTHFSERRWETIFRSAAVALDPGLRELCEATDVKRRDAVRAVERLARDAPAGGAPAPRAPRPRATAPRRAAPPAERYPGHDRRLGYPSATLRRELTRWLLASGRYRRYLSAGPDAKALESRGAAGRGLWQALARTGALEPELMRWYAVQRLSELDEQGDPVAEALNDARRAVALEHGFGDWRRLLDDAQPGVVAGLVPLAWVADASRTLALARQNLSYPPLAPLSTARRPPPRNDSTNSGLAASSDGVPSIRS